MSVKEIFLRLVATNRPTERLKLILETACANNDLLPFLVESRLQNDLDLLVEVLDPRRILSIKPIKLNPPKRMLKSANFLHAADDISIRYIQILDNQYFSLSFFMPNLALTGNTFPGKIIMIVNVIISFYNMPE